MEFSKVFVCILIHAITLTLARPEAPFPQYSTLNLNQPSPPAFQGNQKFVTSQINHVPAAQQNVQYIAQPSPPRQDFDNQGLLASNSNNNYIQAPCTTIDLPNGDIKIVCKPRNPEDLTFRARHVLWIPSGSQDSRNYNIEVDNYKLEELIQAGFKGPVDTSSQFNILVKRPQYNYEAQVDKPNVIANKPKINLNYETVRDLYVHYPTDKGFSPLQGRIELPEERQAGAGGINPRFSRNPNPQQVNRFQQSVQPQHQQFQNQQFRPSIQTAFQPQNQKRSSQ